MNDSVQSGLMNLRDAGAYLGVSMRTARRMMDCGMLPVIRVAKCVRVSKKDLDDFIQRHRVSAIG